MPRGPGISAGRSSRQTDGLREQVFLRSDRERASRDTDNEEKRLLPADGPAGRLTRGLTHASRHALGTRDPGCSDCYPEARRLLVLGTRSGVWSQRERG